MYVDSSAILAILLEEPDAPELLKKLAEASDPFTSIVTKVEASLAFGRVRKDVSVAARIVSNLLRHLHIREVPAEPAMFEHVINAAAQYGKESGHPAKLNFGDCFSYAYAKQAGVPLLYKGNDFARTDLAGL